MKESLTKLGSAGAAFLASLCCIGPLILAGFGIGGAGMATGLAEYRPLLMGLTGTLLGAAFYYTYRKREVVCEDGSCKTCRGSKSSKVSLWGITGLIVLLFIFPYLNWKTLSASETIGDNNLVSSILQIGGMTCASCENTIEFAVGNITGISRVKVSYTKKAAEISFDPKEVSEQDVIHKIEDLGFTASLEN